MLLLQNRQIYQSFEFSMQTTSSTKTSGIFNQNNNNNNNLIYLNKTKIEQKITLRGFKSLNRKNMYSPAYPTFANHNNHVGNNIVGGNSNGCDNKNMLGKYREQGQMDQQINNKQNIKDTQNIKNIIRYSENITSNTNAYPHPYPDKPNQPTQKPKANPTTQNIENDINMTNTQKNSTAEVNSNKYTLIRRQQHKQKQNQKRTNSNGFRYIQNNLYPNNNRSNSKNKFVNRSQKQNIAQLQIQHYHNSSSNTDNNKQYSKKKQKRLSIYQNSPVTNTNTNLNYNMKNNQIKQFGGFKNYNKLAIHTSNKKQGQQYIPNYNNNSSSNYRSPTKQTPLYITVSNNYGNIICQSVSKDGNYRVVSRALNVQQLKQASQLQHHINLKSKKQSIKQLQNQNNNTNVNNNNTNYRTNSFTNNSPRILHGFKQKQKYVLDPSKISTKQNGNIKAYAVNSNQGISRKYNEDRVSIILNIMKNGVKATFFAIYDGHGGSNCCDFLTQNLHQFVFNSKHFPSQPRQALIQGMKLAQTKFIENAKNAYHERKQLDKSGSCAIVLLIVGDDCYIANLGDSRAVLSTCNGKPMYSLSRDHKPTDSGEQSRIIKQGGKIYRTQMMKIKKQSHDIQNKKKDDRNYNSQQTQQIPQNQVIIGPLRVFPGKLSVTRTFGDIQAKQPQLGGIRNCISTDPQICKYTISGKQDFILLGCDGLFQKLDSQQVIEQAWKSIKKTKGTIHEAVGAAAQSVVKLCMDRKSTDNITAIVVALGTLGLQNSITDYASV